MRVVVPLGRRAAARRLYARQGRLQEYGEIVDRLKAERVSHLESFPELTPEIVKAIG